MAPQRPNRRTNRRAVTLLELLLTMAVLVALGALTWPILTRVFDGQRLRMAADQVRAELGSARAEAINSGQVQAMQFQLGAAQYTVQPWQNEIVAMQTALPVATFGTEADAPQGMLTTSAGRIIQGNLPDGITFFSGGETTAGMSQVAMPTAQPQGFGEPAAAMTSTPQSLLFYPDGQTSTARIWLVNTQGRYIGIELRGLTGVTSVSDITTGEELVP